MRVSFLLLRYRCGSFIPHIAANFPGKWYLDSLALGHQSLKSSVQSCCGNLESPGKHRRIGVDSLGEVDLEEPVESLVQQQALCSGNPVRILFSYQRVMHCIALAQKDFGQQQVRLQFLHSLQVSGARGSAAWKARLL